MTRIKLFALFVLVAVGMLFTGCGKFLTGPSTIPPVVMPPTISVPPGSILNEGDQVTVSISFNPGTGSVVVAFALLRDDGSAMMTDNCGPAQGVGTGTGTVTFKGASYLWAKGHILNGAMLEAHFEDRNEAFRNHGCYFLDPSQDPFSVHFERATKRTDTVLNWRVN